MLDPLMSAVASQRVEIPAGELCVQQLTWDELRSRRPEYEALLSRSEADPLFHSFDWLDLWWLHFGRPSEGDELMVLAVEHSGRLCAVLPTIRHVAVTRGRLKYRASAVLGNLPVPSRGIPTEYTTIVAEPGFERLALPLLLRRWAALCRDRELSIGWTHVKDLWIDSLRDARARAWEVVREIDPKEAYSVNLRDGFNQYLAMLSVNARRSMFNLRRKLELSIGLSFHSIDGADALNALDRMNALHALRWTKPAFSSATLDFHRQLIGRLPTSQVKFSELRSRDEVISVLYDVRKDGRQYNLQMGFDPKATPNASLGIIHLGFAIEEAASAGVEHYDFLGGEGMQSDYKRRYANGHVRLCTVQHLRGPILNAALIARNLSQRLIDTLRKRARTTNLA
jgi:CelD/BcsL family acetyltransferase involved in cellulose biosynthesis